MVIYHKAGKGVKKTLARVKRIIFFAKIKSSRRAGFFICADNYIAAINELAPNAYAHGKKQSRIFKTLCDSLGVTDNSAGSQFQRLFAQFADEINGKKIDFKLFVSINPVHFLTMSNPKGDKRGATLVSCHSFNVTDYEYNNGCSGYARDGVTFIVFTVADPDVAETLNNRKTSRQLFMYKPHNWLLLQSRLYNTRGGTRGEQAESKLFRDLVQREISELENVPKFVNKKPRHTSRQVHLETFQSISEESWSSLKKFSPMMIFVAVRTSFLRKKISSPEADANSLSSCAFAKSSRSWASLSRSTATSSEIALTRGLILSTE